MGKIFKFLSRNLSLLAFICIYIIVAVTLIFLESFQFDTQCLVLTTLAPFFIMGAILDYMVYNNKELKPGYKILAQLLPTGIFLLFGMSVIADKMDQYPPKSFNYLIWLFYPISLFIASYFKENHRNRMFSALLGCGFVAAVYLHLTTLTNQLNEGSGLIIYLICLFLIFYAAAGLKKLVFIGGVLGFLDGAALIFLKHNPLSESDYKYGWDFNIAYRFELILLTNFIICSILCLHAAIKRSL